MRVITSILPLVILLCGVLSGCGYLLDDPEPKQERPLVYVKQEVSTIGNPIDSVTFDPGSDLYLRLVSSPSIDEINLTEKLTLGKGDVSDPEPSYDGNQIVFSMRCSPESSIECADDTTWNLWIYEHSSKDLFRVIDDFFIANLGDDVDPVFLPDGRIVFSSTRQTKTRDALNYVYLDEDWRSPVTALHVINFKDTPSGAPRITQISFNQSHDRNPSIMQDGRILYSRWDHVGKHNKISLYTMNPDGSNMNILYGSHSPGESFLHAREVSPGRLVSTVMPLAGTWEGGALVDIDTARFSDYDTTVSGVPAGNLVGQKSATENSIPLGRERSKYGRFTTPYAIVDPNRVGEVLVSYSPFQPRKDVDEVSGETVVDNDVEGLPVYSIYLFDMDTKSLKLIAIPEDGFAYTDPVLMEPRSKPAKLPQYSVVLLVADPDKGIINIKSVYDTDGRERMGQAVLTPEERILTPIPLLVSPQTDVDMRSIPDIARLKDSLLTSADQRPARFVRITQAIPTRPELPRTEVGETSFEMQQIIGYAPIEPDGSVRVKVPADVPFIISVLDKAGRAFQLHTSWLQVRAGEELVCNGCHSPIRGKALNVSPVAGVHPNTRLRKASAKSNVVEILDTGESTTQPQQNETMAEYRTRLDPTALDLSLDIEYEDVWTTPANNASANFAMRYEDLSTPQPSIDEGTGGIVINYPDHIQPLWSDRKNLENRTGNTAKQCTDCHGGIKDDVNNPNRLDLFNSFDASTGRKKSYEALTRGELLYDDTGGPVFESDDGGIPVIRRSTPFVEPGYARGSYLIEKLFNQELYANRGLLAQGLDHSEFLTAVEKRLVVEWIDLGVQYKNSLKDIDELPPRQSRAVFDFFIYQVNGLFASQEEYRCTRCHHPKSNSFEPSNFVLSDSLEGNFNTTASFLTDFDNPENSRLLSIPSSIGPHPYNHFIGGETRQPFLPKGSKLYDKIVELIVKMSIDRFGG